MNKLLTYIALVVVGVVVGIGVVLIFNFKTGLLSRQGKVQSDTTTTIHYDTIRTIPEFVSSKQVGVSVYPIKQVPILLATSDTVKTPYFIHDTLMIPIEQKYYAGESYKAWVSGYKPSLDSMTIFQPTTTITIENTAQKVARNELYLSADIKYIAPFPAMTTGITAGFNRDRWGVSLGGGIIAVPNGVKWYALVGLKYNLLTKKW